MPDRRRLRYVTQITYVGEACCITALTMASRVTSVASGPGTPTPCDGVNCPARGITMKDERERGWTPAKRKADTEYVEDALGIEDEYESELAAVQVKLARFEVSPYEYAASRAEIAARAYL